MAEQVSILKEYSMGIVAAPKATNSRMIQVFLREVTPYASGQVAVNPQKIEYKGTDARGKSYEDQVVTDTTVQAEWMPSGSNRITPPDVRKGERVRIYRFGDQDKFYWKETGLDDHLRRQETVVFGINASPESDTDKDVKQESQNTYFLEMSSHKKHVLFSTSNGNGEACTYTIKINTGEGNLVIADSIGNSVLLDSIDELIQVLNQSGTLIKLDKRTLLAQAPDTIDFTATNTITLGAKNINFKCDVFDAKASDSFSISAGNRADMKTEVFGINATKASIKAADIELVGNVKQSGGYMKSNGVPIDNTHVHGGVKSGGDKSETPE